MALINTLNTLTRTQLHILHPHTQLCARTLLLLNQVQTRGYAKKAAVKGKGKGAVKEVLKGPEACKDPVRLTSHAVGVNIYKQGEDPPLKPKEEYPVWLFELNLGPPKKFNELDPNSHEYWKCLRKEHMWRFNRLHKGKKL